MYSKYIYIEINLFYQLLWWAQRKILKTALKIFCYLYIEWRGKEKWQVIFNVQSETSLIARWRNHHIANQSEVTNSQYLFSFFSNRFELIIYFFQLTTLQIETNWPGPTCFNQLYLKFSSSFSLSKYFKSFIFILFILLMLEKNIIIFDLKY